MLRRISIIIFLLLGMRTVSATELPDTLTADTLPKGTWSFSLGGNVGYFMHSGPDIQKILHSYTVSYYDLRAKWQAVPSLQANAYDRAMNYPRLQLGLMYADMNHLKIHHETRNLPYDSRIGYILTLYGGIQLDMWRSGRWSAGVDLQNGIGYCPHPYDIYNNDDQWIIGSRLTIFVSLGAFLRYQMSPHWAISAGVDFKHYSNGTLDRPNLGANSVGPSVAVEYDLTPQAPSTPPEWGGASTQSHGVLPHSGELKGASSFYVDAVAGMGMRALNDANIVNHTSTYSIYAFPTILIAPMWR